MPQQEGKPSRQPPRWHSRTGIDWLEVQLEYAKGESLAGLHRKFGVGVEAILARRRTEGWSRELSLEARGEMEILVARAQRDRPAPKPASADGRRRGGRWGRSGCDWLAMELDYALGKRVEEIAESGGVTKSTVRKRSSLDGWLRDPPPERLLELSRAVEAAAIAADLRANKVEKARSRLLALNEMERPSGARKEKRRTMNGGHSQAVEPRQAGPVDEIDYVGELRRRLTEIVDSIEQKSLDGDGDGVGEHAGEGEGDPGGLQLPPRA